MEATENSAEIKQLSKMKEGQYFDRKSSRIEPKQIIKHLIAFANASGGKLVIGIEDDGTITGFNNPKAHSIEDFKHILNEGQKTPIPLSIETINVVNNKGESDVILVFDVEPSTHRVIEANDGQAYLRSKDNSILLKFEQRKLLEYDKGQRSFEDEIVRDSSLEDLDMDLLEKYKDHLNSHDSSIKEILKARNFINKDLNLCTRQKNKKV